MGGDETQAHWKKFNYSMSERKKTVSSTINFKASSVRKEEEEKVYNLQKACVARAKQHPPKIMRFYFEVVQNWSVR